ncbi:hypothetical protein KY343_06050 [Candidatus Woesearchaeota archaeon]|nr:hypothetical protein [Candidatus Woesearchaeota archaeon]
MKSYKPKGIIKRVRNWAIGAAMYAAAALGCGCSTMPMYETVNDTSIVRFENMQDLTDKLNCWSRIDIKSAADDPQNMEAFFAKIMPEYKLGKGFSIAAQYLAVPDRDIIRAGVAYGKKIGANKFAKFRILAPMNDASNPEIDVLLVYNGDKAQGSALVLYDPKNNSVIASELTATFGKGNVKPIIQLAASGPIGDLETKLFVGAELKPKK